MNYINWLLQCSIVNIIDAYLRIFINIYLCITILCRDIPLVVLDCANIGWSYGKYDDDDDNDSIDDNADSKYYIGDD